MATLWGDVARKVEAKLKTALPYARISIIGDASDYIQNNVAQAIVDEINVLIAPPGGETYVPSNQPLLAGFFRKKYDFEIVVVSKTDPTMVGRLLGPNPNKRGIDKVLNDIHSALEHNNLGHFVDNKAWSNFEGGWVKSPSEDKAVTIYTTIYTAIKTER